MAIPLLPTEPPTPEAMRARWPTLAAAALLSISLFVLDLYTPVRLAVWLPYTGVILLTLTVPGRWPVLSAAAACSVLTMVGYLQAAPSAPAEVSLINRSWPWSPSG